MERTDKVQATRKRAQEKYQQPLLIKHEPLVDITGAKYLEKLGAEKIGVEKAATEKSAAE